jgi:hypothetical protein
MENFGIESRTRKTSRDGKPVLYILPSSKDRLIDIVKPYVNPAMIDMLNNGPNDGPNDEPNDKFFMFDLIRRPTLYLPTRC